MGKEETVKTKNDEFLKLVRSNEKKKAAIAILAFLAAIFAMLAALFYFGIVNSGKKDAPETNVEPTECQCEKCENKECQCENTNANDNQSTSNSYKKFSDNLKKEILNWSTQSFLAKDGVGYLNNEEVAYKIILTNKMILKMTFNDEQYQKKYGEKIIADNVISFSIAQSGPGGYQNVYFIKEDGTVGEAIPTNLFDESINKLTITYPIKDLKNIVSIVTASYQDGGYMQEPVFIDINGNVLEAALSAWD